MQYFFNGNSRRITLFAKDSRITITAMLPLVFLFLSKFIHLISPPFLHIEGMSTVWRISIIQNFPIQPFMDEWMVLRHNCFETFRCLFDVEDIILTVRFCCWKHILSPGKWKGNNKVNNMMPFQSVIKLSNYIHSSTKHCRTKVTNNGILWTWLKIWSPNLSCSKGKSWWSFVHMCPHKIKLL